MLPLFRPTRRVHFVLTQGAGQLTLAEAMAGATGQVAIGPQGVRLWVPGYDMPDKAHEIVCDLRNRPITEKTCELFVEAAQGRFMTAHVGLLQLDEYGMKPEEILARTGLHYLLVPNRRIRNAPEDFRKRVLAYEQQ